MNCEGVRQVVDKGISGTTRAERNAACVHFRSCEACRKVVYADLWAMKPKLFREAINAANAALAEDRSDPEWK